MKTQFLCIEISCSKLFKVDAGAAVWSISKEASFCVCKLGIPFMLAVIH